VAERRGAEAQDRRRVRGSARAGALARLIELLLIALILLLVVAFVTAPLRSARRETNAPEDPRLADLEARKEAKYREIRDAEMDRAAGKLSEEDWRRQDAELRREAIRILKQIDEAEADARTPSE
jgi:predicted Holliday junction resolvase-like endonuclease